MAVDKNVLLASITQYQQTNERPMAKNVIIATHGADAVDTLKTLVSEGLVSCRRGRNGGFYPAAPAAVSVTEEAAEVSEPVVEDDVAAQFAALNAKLAADEAAEQEPTEPLPF